MVRFLLMALVWLASAALGLLVANWVLDDMEITTTSFLLAVVVFAAAQSVLAPFVAKMARRYAPALLGGIGLVTTVIALVVTTTFTDGLSITGAMTWVYASLIVWIVTMLATLALPVLVVKRVVDKRSAGSGQPAT
jgi:hypothetical protein